MHVWLSCTVGMIIVARAMVPRCRVPAANVRPADISPFVGKIVGVLAGHENSALGVCSTAQLRQLANLCRLPQPCRACLRGVLTSQPGRKANGHSHTRFAAVPNWPGSWEYGHAEKLCSGVGTARATGKFSLCRIAHAWL